MSVAMALVVIAIWATIGAWIFGAVLLIGIKALYNPGKWTAGVILAFLWPVATACKGFESVWDSLVENR